MDIGIIHIIYSLQLFEKDVCVFTVLTRLLDVAYTMQYAHNDYECGLIDVIQMDKNGTNFQGPRLVSTNSQCGLKP